MLLPGDGSAEISHPQKCLLSRDICLKILAVDDVKNRHLTICYQVLHHQKRHLLQILFDLLRNFQLCDWSFYWWKPNRLYFVYHRFSTGYFDRVSETSLPSNYW